MTINKSLLSGSTTLLILHLLESGEKYGYEMIDCLEKQSQNVFQMKEGTLYPVLHALEAKGAIRGFDRQTPAGRTRRYYAITDKGRRQLKEETEQWQSFSGAVNTVLGFAG